MKRTSRLSSDGSCSSDCSRKVPKYANCKEDLKDSIRTGYAKLLETSQLTDVDTLLARWWRQRSRELSNGTTRNVVSATTSVSPSTRLRQICRLAEAKKFLAYCITHLEYLLLEEQHKENKFSICFTLAGCLHRLRRHREALDKTKMALEITEDPKVVWFSRLVQKQLKYDEDRASRLLSVSLEPIKFPTAVPVERRDASELSLQEFYTSYASAHVPVVITGLVQLMTKTPWTLDYIKSVIGSKIAPLKRHMGDSAEWAKLESAGSCTVAEFITSLSNEEETRYLFDWSLPLYAPELATELTIPKYFANDFLQRATNPDHLYQDSWPSMFIARKGVSSDMHVDSFGSNFWMALFQGKKRWTFFSHEDTCCLYPQLDSSMDPTFEAADFTELNINNYPALSCVTPRECILCAGEVLFVPAGCPHKVENLDTSLAISANFVDGSNFELVQQELQTNGLIDERSAKLFEIFSSKRFDSRMDFEIPHLPWSRFKHYTHTCDCTS